jgi:outer membrane protein assembly factor BamD (BamD/ComL family)
MQGRRTVFRLGRLLLGPAFLLAGLAGCHQFDAAKSPSGNASRPANGPTNGSVMQAGHVEPAAVNAEPPQLADAMELYRREEFDKARKLFNKVAGNTQNTPLVAEKARFHEAECLRHDNYLPEAADTYNKMLIDFPAGVYREQAVQRMFEIADLWLDDTRAQMQADKEKAEGKRWWVPPIYLHWDRSKPLLDQEGRALQLLEQVHYNDPTGPCSDKALFLAGYVHFYRGNFREADQFFSQLIEMHDKSPLKPRAVELAIMAKNNSTGGPLYDGRKSAEALTLVHQARATMPEMASHADYLDGQIVAIRQQEADKELITADFYRRTGHAGSAYFCYELVKRRYPNSEQARVADARMKELYGELEASRREQGFWATTRRGWNKYVLAAPSPELKPGQNMPPPPSGSAASTQPVQVPAVATWSSPTSTTPGRTAPSEAPRSLPAELTPRP